MINRVQAFNNKNNYKQNFGMALICGNEAARSRVNTIANRWGTHSKQRFMELVQGITSDRANDKFVDIFIKEGEELETAVFEIQRKDGSQVIPSSEPIRYTIRSDKNGFFYDGDVQQPLARLSTNARDIDTKLEKEHVEKLDALQGVSNAQP